MGRRNRKGKLGGKTMKEFIFKLNEKEIKGLFEAGESIASILESAISTIQEITKPIDKELLNYSVEVFNHFRKDKITEEEMENLMVYNFFPKWFISVMKRLPKDSELRKKMPSVDILENHFKNISIRKYKSRLSLLDKIRVRIAFMLYKLKGMRG